MLRPVVDQIVSLQKVFTMGEDEALVQDVIQVLRYPGDLVGQPMDGIDGASISVLCPVNG